MTSYDETSLQYVSKMHEEFEKRMLRLVKRVAELELSIKKIKVGKIATIESKVRVNADDIKRLKVLTTDLNGGGKDWSGDYDG